MHGLIIREVTEIQLHPINMNREDGLVSGKPLNHSLKEQKKNPHEDTEQQHYGPFQGQKLRLSFHLTFFSWLSLLSLLNFPVKTIFLICYVLPLLFAAFLASAESYT